MRAQRVRGGESRVEMQFAKWTAEGAVAVVISIGSISAYKYITSPKEESIPLETTLEDAAELTTQKMIISDVFRSTKGTIPLINKNRFLVQYKTTITAGLDVQNAKIKEAVMKLLNERDGLALGICNGFQALIKLGLVPYGEICGQKEDSPTLTYNTIGRHISKMVYTKVVSNKSPWLQKATLGGVYCNPASHGEGRFVANDEWLAKLLANGQVATQYVNPNGELDQSEESNINGSTYNIEGITSPDGRVLGKMAHSERRDNGVAINIYGQQDIQIFESGVEYFK